MDSDNEEEPQQQQVEQGGEEEDHAAEMIATTTEGGGAVERTNSHDSYNSNRAEDSISGVPIFPVPVLAGSGSTPRPHRPPPTPSQVSQTPLVAATPRTPSSQNPFTSPLHRPLPRGDVRGGSYIPRAPAPTTPQGWNASQMSDPTAAGASGGAGANNSYNIDGAGGIVGNNLYGTVAPMEFEGANEPSVIWGTNINIEHCLHMFQDFIENYSRANEFEPHYIHILTNMFRSRDKILNVDCTHLVAHPRARRLYSHLVSFPNEIIPVMDRVINDKIFPRFISQDVVPDIQVRTYGLQKVVNMRDLDPVNIDQLISIKGMVVRCSSVIPELKQAFFKCALCAHSVEVVVEKNRITEPGQCSECRSHESMQIVHNRCLFADKQLIRLQESVDEIPEGETPQTVNLFVHDDLVDTVRPGDRIVVTGVYRAIPRKANPRVRTLLRVYKTFVDVVHMKNDRSVGESTKDSASSSGDFDGKVRKYTEAQIQDFEDFSRHEDVYDRLVQAFAPSIWEMDDVKRGVLCQLFGGTLESVVESNRVSELQQESSGEAGVLDDVVALSQERQGGAGSSRDKVRLRGDINILLCGDPGTSKSQILSYVHKISPRGIYTSGKGSSAVGLTASVVRDPDTKDSVLESGALVLSDNGICCIDEFDKMSDLTRAILHEAMEQQTVSITKAGIIATLNARTSILASANPVESRYNARLSVVENIKLPPTLLSRFDLIYLILDKPNAETDRRLARHLVSLYYDESERGNGLATSITQEFLRDYITYARSHMAPEVSAAAGDLLVSGYLEMRAMGNRGTKTISATPRQLESLIRISQALAKMKLSNTVTETEVREAVRLMRVATQAAATDPRTGTIDMDLINTGRTALDKGLVLMLAEEMKRMLQTRKGQRLSVAQLRVLLSENTEYVITLTAVEEAVRELEGEGVLQFNERTLSVVVRGSTA